MVAANRTLSILRVIADNRADVSFSTFTRALAQRAIEAPRIGYHDDGENRSNRARSTA